MSRLFSKITLISLSLVTAAIVINLSYSPSTQANMTHQTKTTYPATVWDEETEPSYQGTLEMTVYRSRSCGCCGEWIKHAEKHGFKVKEIQTESMESIKQEYNIPSELFSCHTTIINGYAMEGHIPVDDIKRFLEKQPKLAGLAVPGMPIGTPGMESSKIKQPFQVLAFNNEGEIEVFKEYQSY